MEYTVIEGKKKIRRIIFVKVSVISRLGNLNPVFMSNVACFELNLVNVMEK